MLFRLGLISPYLSGVYLTKFTLLISLVCSVAGSLAAGRAPAGLLFCPLRRLGRGPSPTYSRSERASVCGVLCCIVEWLGLICLPLRSTTCSMYYYIILLTRQGAGALRSRAPCRGSLGAQVTPQHSGATCRHPPCPQPRAGSRSTVRSQLAAGRRGPGALGLPQSASGARLGQAALAGESAKRGGRPSSDPLPAPAPESSASSHAAARAERRPGCPS